MSVRKIVVVDNDQGEGDWEGLYLGGVLVGQGHSHTAQMAFEALGVEFEHRDATHYLEEHGRLPDQIEELDEVES